MKKIILLVVLLYASSCAVQYNEAYYMADFRPYTEEGFIISPLSSYAAPYKPLATICIEFTPGYDRTYVNEKIVESKVNDDMYLSANGKKQQWRCPTQKDLSPGTTSGLDVALKVLKKVDEIGICELTSQDVVRHPVVQKIVKAYEDYENRNKKKPAEQKKKWEKR